MTASDHTFASNRKPLDTGVSINGLKWVAGRLQALNQSSGEQMRSTFHIHAVNDRHSGLKDFLRRHRGDPRKYLEKLPAMV